MNYNDTTINIARVIARYNRKHNKSPTFDEIMGVLRISSKSVVGHHVRLLEEGGFILRDAYRARGITPTPRINDLMPLSERVIRLSLPYPVSVNNAYQRAGHRVILSDAARSFKEQAGWSARAQYNDDPLEGNLAMNVYLYRPSKKGDIDNVAKLLLDAMQTIVYVNDAQIVELHIYRNDDAKNPRAEVEVWSLSLPPFCAVKGAA